jgi:hypothetical protein
LIRPQRSASVAAIGSPAGEYRVQGDLERDLPGEAKDPAGGRDEAPLDLGQTEAGALDGDDEVTGQCEFGATAQSRTVYGGDRRLGGELVDEAGEAPLLLALGDDSLAPHDRLEIGPGAEGRIARTGQDDRPNLRVTVCGRHSGTYEHANVLVHGIARLRSIEGDDARMTVLLNQYLRLCRHRLPSLLCMGIPVIVGPAQFAVDKFAIAKASSFALSAGTVI